MFGADLFIGSTEKLLINLLRFSRRLRLNAAKMSKETLKDKGKITPAEAVKILKRSGEEITEKEAEKVLKIMYFLAKLIVNQNFNK